MKKNLVFILIIILIAGTGIWILNSKGKKSQSPASLKSSPSTSLQTSASLASPLAAKTPPIAQVVYVCNGGKTIDAAFYEGRTRPVKQGEPPIPTGSAKIILSDGRNYILPQTISADGGRYANKDESFVFWSKGEGALVLENNAEKDYVDCVVPSNAKRNKKPDANDATSSIK
jgi:membrane-bound inhibitor of C-type lysozyme